MEGQSKQCLYEVLGIQRNCSEEEVKKSYKKQALLYHPDKAPWGKEEEYKTRFQEINEAY